MIDVSVLLPLSPVFAVDVWTLPPQRWRVLLY
jgi:hypothetical protein